MKKQPIIFAMANPEPEIMPDEVRKVFPDAIIATGRSDLPNQVNNVLGFPYIFRGALDVRATTINEEMKKAAVYAIANLARENVPDEVSNAYGQDKITYGVDYIIPAPFDPRLIVEVSSAVAKAAIDSGVATNPIKNIALYKKQLARRLNPTASMLQRVSDKVSNLKKRIVFADGEDENTLKAAIAFKNSGLGIPILVWILFSFKILDFRIPLSVSNVISLLAFSFDKRLATHLVPLPQVAESDPSEFLKIKYGADWIKLHATGSVPGRPGELLVWNREEIKAACQTAHELSVPVMAHCRGAQSVQVCAEEGVDLILHASFMDDDGLEAVISNLSLIHI